MSNQEPRAESLEGVIDRYDMMVRDVVMGVLSMRDFVDEYDSFYMHYALDGHEADELELAELKRLEDRIAIHRDIWETIIAAGLTASPDSALDSQYRQANRFGYEEGLRRLRELVKKHPNFTS